MYISPGFRRISRGLSGYTDIYIYIHIYRCVIHGHKDLQGLGFGAQGLPAALAACF